MIKKKLTSILSAIMISMGVLTTNVQIVNAQEVVKISNTVTNLEDGNYTVGKILKGSLFVGNKLICFSKDKKIVFKVKGIEKLNHIRLKQASEGDIVGLKIKGKNIDDIKKDDYFVIPAKNKRN